MQPHGRLSGKLLETLTVGLPWEPAVPAHAQKKRNTRRKACAPVFAAASFGKAQRGNNPHVLEEVNRSLQAWCGHMMERSSGVRRNRALMHTALCTDPDGVTPSETVTATVCPSAWNQAPGKDGTRPASSWQHHRVSELAAVPCSRVQVLGGGAGGRPKPLGP